MLLLLAIFLLAIQFPQSAALHSAGSGACTAAIREAGHHIREECLGITLTDECYFVLISSKRNKIAAFSRVCSSAAVCTCRR